MSKPPRVVTALVYGLSAALISIACFIPASCTATQRATFKAHGLETGIAASAGVAAVLVGSVAVAAPVVLGGMFAAALVGEVNKPPPLETHTTTVIDEKGKILSQKTTTAAAKPQETSMEFLTSRNFIILVLALLALAFPATRALAVQALSSALQAAKAAPAWIRAHLKSLRTQKRPERNVAKPAVLIRATPAHNDQPGDQTP